MLRKCRNILKKQQKHLSRANYGDNDKVLMDGWPTTKEFINKTISCTLTYII